MKYVVVYATHKNFLGTIDAYKQYCEFIFQGFYKIRYVTRVKI